ncbi:single-stranded DNA-binding protein [Carnobacterium maltaromaticum]|uniref:single-stranded DNA-binding protein n=1 Tax=Carnobacterium maltaromaticum TaxID=2751 RepID=UPI003990AEAA
MISYQTLLNIVNNLPSGTIFIISDLFPPIQWKAQPVRQRRLLGIRFLDDVQNGALPNIVPKGKNSSNAQLYNVL